MHDSIWERYHACRRIWDAYVNGDAIASKMTKSCAQHYEDIVVEIESYWGKENPELGCTKGDFEEAYTAWLRQRP